MFLFLLKVRNSFLIIDNGESFIMNFEYSNYIQEIISSFSLKSSQKLQGGLNKKYIIKVVCGAGFVTLLTHAGMVFSYGVNDRGQLGQGNTTPINDPTMITSTLNYRILDIASGDSHIIALGIVRDLTKSKTDNDKNVNNMILVWGDNTYGQIGNFNEDMIVTPTLLEEFNELKINKIDTGLNHSVVLLDNLKAFAFGSNNANQITYNHSDEVVKAPLKIKINNFGDFVDCKCSPNSTMYITHDDHLILLGEITKNKPRIFKISNRENLQFIFNDSSVLLIHESKDYVVREIIVNNNNNVQNSENLENVLSSPDNNENNLHTEFHDNLFKDFDMSKDLITEPDTDLFDNLNFEQSIEELRSYINLVGISFNADSSVSTAMSFRPKNLPKKTPQEEEYHRQLVEENRRTYMKLLRERQEQERQQRQRIEIRKQRMRKLQEKWEIDILPAWFKYRNDIKSISSYFYYGIPSPIRGKVWLLCIGNNFSITPEYYEIELKKGIDLLLVGSQRVEKVDEENHPVASRYNIRVINKEQSIKYIDMDIERTFTYLGIFSGKSPLAEDLREILRAFVASRPDIGYVYFQINYF
jgi:hypothetical protein